MNHINQERVYVGDNAGRHADSMCGAQGAVGLLVLLFIFLVIIAWAVHSGHDRTRDGVRDGNALGLAAFTKNNDQVGALALIVAEEKGRNGAILATLLANSDRTLERQCALAQLVERGNERVINHGETWGFQSFRREPCCEGRRDRDGGGGTNIDFNTGVQTLTALGSVLGRGGQGAGS